MVDFMGLFILNDTAKMKLEISAFSYCGEIMKNSIVSMTKRMTYSFRHHMEFEGHLDGDGNVIIWRYE